MTDLITGVSDNYQIDFADTVIGRIFNSCITGCVPNNCGIPNFELFEKIVTCAGSNDPVVNVPGGTLLYNERIILPQVGYPGNNPITLGKFGKSPTCDVVAYCILNIGKIMYNTIHKYLSVTRITPIVLRDDLWEHQLSDKYFDEVVFKLESGHAIDTTENQLIFSRVDLKKTQEERISIVKYNIRVIRYLRNWLDTAKVTFEAKRNELYNELMVDNYDEQLSKKTMAALETEASLAACEVSQLPQYTIDSIARAVRRENPRVASSENLHLATMKALTPYIVASCAELVKRAEQFVALM